ncbi:MAG: pyridoxal 4-dehydrogenase [Alphaproteobacteria bacterium]|nr:pyridoxal 4-dehydrogenase [Alphaproteobacteria bacterium]
MSAGGRRRLGRTALELPPIGFGAAPVGNLYRPMSDEEAAETIAAALDSGLRYIDTAPYYGFGLSERRVGEAIRGRKDVIVSTKVGRLLLPAGPTTDPRVERHGFLSPMPFTPIFDYSYSGVLRSYEASLQRLGLSRVDILLVHDIGRMTHGNGHGAHLEALTLGGGLRALERLRDEGTVSAIGLGVNEIPICLDLIRRAPLDLILLAGRYTLLEQKALDRLLPLCAAADVSVVIGGPYNSGILAGGSSPSPHYDYAPAPAQMVERAARIERICARHGVETGAAALQFVLAHPAVASVIPGLASIEQVRQTVKRAAAAIPPALWRDLKSEGLLDRDAPVPVEGAVLAEVRA